MGVSKWLFVADNSPAALACAAAATGSGWLWRWDKPGSCVHARCFDEAQDSEDFVLPSAVVISDPILCTTLSNGAFPTAVGGRCARGPFERARTRANQQHGHARTHARNHARTHAMRKPTRQSTHVCVSTKSGLLAGHLDCITLMQHSSSSQQFRKCHASVVETTKFPVVSSQDHHFSRNCKQSQQVPKLNDDHKQ